MDLSIIIVNWNTKDLLVDCIQSLVETSPKVSYEVIVVDNGSSDGSVEALEKFKKKVNLTVIQNSTNTGFSKANNQGIRQAKGHYILLLNSDTKVKKGSVDTLYEFAKSDDQIGVVGARLLDADGSIQSSCFRKPTILNAIREFWLGEKGLTAKYYPEGNNPTEVDVVVGAALLITPQAREKVGLLNEKYFFFYEDLDYCRSVKNAGLKVYYLPTAEVYHYHGSTVRKVTDKSTAWKNLIPGSKIYHGLLGHYIYNFILWSGQKLFGSKS